MILPILVLIVLLYGISKKINIYDTFIEGSKESFDLIVTMFPTMLAMIFGINIFVKSGLIDVIFKYNPINFIPKEIFPMIILRPISGSATLATLNSIFKNYGPDSLSGLLGSVIQGSTDTTFYVLTLYFGSIGVKKIKYSMIAGLFADLVGIVSAIIIVKIMM